MTALRTFGLGLAGSIPGAAWRLSVDMLGGVLDMVPFAIGVAVLLTWIAMIRRRDALRADDPMASISDATLAGAVAVALAIYWLVAILVQAITVKVQDETIELGYVYTSYSFGAAVIALFLAIVGRAAIHDSRFRGALPVLGRLCRLLRPRATDDQLETLGAVERSGPAQPSTPCLVRRRRDPS